MGNRNDNKGYSRPPTIDDLVLLCRLLFVIDLLASACQIDYEHAKQYIVYKDINGVKVPFAGIDILIKMKKGIRPKDKEDLLFLKRLKEKGS